MVCVRPGILYVLASTLLLHATACATTLQGIRFGQQGTLSRIVFTLQQEASYRLDAGADPLTLRVVFPGLALASKSTRFQASDPLVREIRLSATSSAVMADIILKYPATVQKQTRLGKPPRLVLDLSRHEDRAPVPATAGAQPPLETPVPQPKPTPAVEPRQVKGLPSPEASAALAPSREGLLRTPVAHSQRSGISPTMPLSSLAPAQLLERAERYWTERNIEAAQRAYTLFVQRYPEHPNNHLITARLADILREQHHPRAALEAYTAVIQGYPGSEGALISQIRLAELGSTFPDLLPPGDEPRYLPYRQPIPTLQRLSAEYPFSPFANVARFKIGTLLLQQQKFVAALESFEELLERPIQESLRQDVTSSLRQALSQLVAEQHRRGAALDVLRTFFVHKRHLSPEDSLQSDLLLPVALSYARLGLLDEAQSLLTSLLPTMTDATQRADLVFDQALRFATSGQLQSAAMLLTPPEQFTDSARRAQALMLLTEAAWQAQNLDDTVRYGQQAAAVLTEPAQRTMIWSLVGAALAARGESTQALQALQQCAKAATPGQSAAVEKYAEMCFVEAAALQVQVGQVSQVLDLYKRFLQTFPTSASKEASLFRMANLYRQKGDTTQMLATFHTLRENTSEAFWHRVASEYLDQAQWQERLQERLAVFQNSLTR